MLIDMQIRIDATIRTQFRGFNDDEIETLLRGGIVHKLTHPWRFYAFLLVFLILLPVIIPLAYLAHLIESMGFPDLMRPLEAVSEWSKKADWWKGVPPLRLNSSTK